MRKIWNRAAVLATIAVLLPWAVAQDQSDADLTKLNLEQLMKVQFYTASKHAEDASATPASVTIITRADIRTYGYRTLADALQGVRGYWVNSDRNYSYLGVRGFARPGDYNTRILLLINGHRLNDNIFYQALIGTEFPLDVDLIERIEIVRGPASSLYGTNAFFGVVNVVTRQPPLSPAAEVAVQAGTQFARQARVTVGLPEVLDGALFSASMYRSDGNDRLYFPEFDSPDNNHGVAQRVDGDHYESAFALVRWKHWQWQGLIGSRKKLIPTASFDTIFNDPANRTIDSRGFGELRYQRDFVSGLQVTSRWFYDALPVLRHVCLPRWRRARAGLRYRARRLARHGTERLGSAGASEYGDGRS
jgi:iron complex outermembrane receptor protein